MVKVKSAKAYLVKSHASGYTPHAIATLRWKTLHLSQALFARVLGVSKQTVNSWECGWREPSMMALQFLHLIEENPDTIDNLIVRREGDDV